MEYAYKLVIIFPDMLLQDARNTIGNIPVEWYNEYPHIGYNLDGKRILKPATADEVGNESAQHVINSQTISKLECTFSY